MTGWPTGLDGPLSPVLLDGLSPGALRLFLGLGLPGGFMMGMEASSFDITTALAGRLGTVAVDAHTILMSVIGTNSPPLAPPSPPLPRPPRYSVFYCLSITH